MKSKLLERDLHSLLVQTGWSYWHFPLCADRRSRNNADGTPLLVAVAVVVDVAAAATLDKAIPPYATKPDMECYSSQNDLPWYRGTLYRKVWHRRHCLGRAESGAHLLGYPVLGTPCSTSGNAPAPCEALFPSHAAAMLEFPSGHSKDCVPPRVASPSRCGIGSQNNILSIPHPCSIVPPVEWIRSVLRRCRSQFFIRGINQRRAVPWA